MRYALHHPSAAVPRVAVLLEAALPSCDDDDGDGGDGGGSRGSTLSSFGIGWAREHRELGLGSHDAVMTPACVTMSPPDVLQPGVPVRDWCAVPSWGRMASCVRRGGVTGRLQEAQP